MKLLYLFLPLLFITAGNVSSQVLSLRGKVVTEAGQPIGGATVTATSGALKKVTETSAEGTFLLPGISADALLQVTHVGFESLDIAVANRTMVTLTLKEKTGALDEVIIQAYGTTTKRLSTGNITKISAKEIESQPVTNPLAAMEGLVPGMVISQSSGVPGSSFNVEIRGRTSLDQALSKNDPLIVIDGVFFEPGNQPANLLRSAANDNHNHGGLSPLNSLNPGDIASIEVLKDADATAIYGSRGANGVILITTKKGRAGATAITAGVYAGASRPAGSMPLLNTPQYVAMRREGFNNDGVPPSADPADPGYAPDIMLWDTTRYTDLKKLLTGNTAHSLNADVSLTGGNRLTRFTLGGNYHRETNVFSKDLDDIKASAHFSISHATENEKLSVVFTGGYASDQNNLIASDLSQYIYLPPNLKLYNGPGQLAWEEDGVSYATVNNIINPLSVLLRTNTSVVENLYTNLQLEYKIAPSLTFKASLGYNAFTTDEVAIVPATAIDPYISGWTKPSSSFANSSTSSHTIEPQLNYLTRLGAGRLNILLGSTWQVKKYEARTIQATDFADDQLLNNPAAAGQVIAGADESVYHYAAIFGRINYDYRHTYLLNATFRRDGSSRFGPGSQFANFGALGTGWIFSETSFFRNKLPWLSFGKIRASYGITGNDEIGDYNFMNLWSNAGNTYQGYPTLLPLKLYNKDFGWETNRKLEVALESGFFKDRLLVTASWYRNRSRNQLINYPLPGQAGYRTVVMNLPALVQNSGMEIEMTGKNVQARNFSWSTSFNISFPHNKLVSFPGLALTSYKNTYVEGQPLNVIHGYKYLGVDPQTGAYTFEDTNKDGTLTTADYQVLGSLSPKYYGGLLNTVTWHNFQLTFLLEFKNQRGKNYLAQLFNSPPGFIANQPSIVLDRWQKPGDVMPVQQFIATYSSRPAYLATNTLLSVSDGIYGNASYIRLKNAALNYNLPPALYQRLKLSGITIYIISQNLFTATHFKGLDPETQNMYVLPPLKTIAGGIRVNF